MIPRYLLRTCCLLLITAGWVTTASRTASSAEHPFAPAVEQPTSPPCVGDADRIWLINTRHLLASACWANVEAPDLRFYERDACGRFLPTEAARYWESRDASRPTVIYVHGNRMEHSDAIARGLFVHREVTQSRCRTGPVDWVIWSWPSEKTGVFLNDFRIKARRTDAQGLYLAWVLRHHVQLGQPTALVGYSFGARVVSGALHALAGGTLGGQELPGDSIQGAAFEVGMLAPAIENDWLSGRGYHRLATKNMNRLTVLYNNRDAVLKNYWRIDNIRNADALGYTGPTSFAPRSDGTALPVQSRDCGAVLGFHHNEVEYYQRPCSADAAIASLVSGTMDPHE